MSYNVSYILGAYSLVTPGAQSLSISVDNGLTWTVKPTVSTLLENNAISVNPNDALKAVIVGNNGALFTVDQGDTWTASTGSFTTAGNYNELCYASANVIYAVGDYLIKSTDSGETFTDLPLTPTSIYGSSASSYCVNFISETVGFIGINDKLYKTIDGGTTWTALNGSSAILTGNNVSSIITSSDGTNIYVSVYSGIFRSYDSGASFIQTAFIPGAISTDNLGLFKQSESLYFASFFADNGSGATDRLLSSTNSGSTWTTYDYGIIGGSTLLRSGLWFYTSQRGITFSPGNNAWETLNAGLTRSAFTGILFKPFAIGGYNFPIYTLYNCEDSEIQINTYQDLSAYVQPSLTVNLVEYPDTCWQVGVGVDDAETFEEVTIDGEPYESCEACVPVYIQLTSCIDSSLEYAVSTTELLANNELVVTLNELEGCWEVLKVTGFPPEVLQDVTILQGGYADCTCCEPTPAPEPEVFVRTTQAPVKKFYHITDSECEIKTNSQFAENYYKLFLGMAYGIANCCTTINFDKLWIKQELSEYSRINPPDACIVPVIEETILDCPTTVLVSCGIPTDVSGTGDFS